VLKLGQGVLHDGLQILLFDVVDMCRLNLMIEEVMEFQRGLREAKSRKVEVSKLAHRVLFVPLKQILPDLKNFYRFVHL
jgi:hypothetical protein